MNFPFKLPLLIDTAAEFYSCDSVAAKTALTENQILEYPEAFQSYLKNTVESGAGAVCAPTFRLNRARLANLCTKEELENLNKKLVRMTREAAGTAFVGGMLGPTGFSVPPFGESDFDDVYAAYREQVCALEDAGADFLLLNRQTSLSDMRAALLAARSTSLPVLVCVSVDENGHTAAGGSFLPILITLQAMGAEAVGVSGPPDCKILQQTIRDALPHSSVPLMILADAGEQSSIAGFVRPVLESGARLIAAGSGFQPQQICALHEILKKYGPPVMPEEPDCYAAAIEREAFFLYDDIPFSEPIPCSTSLEDDLIDLDDEQVSAALVVVNSVDDAVLLGRNSTMTKLPVAVHADNLSVLEAALRYFQGRLIIDSDCQIDRDSLEPLAAKYGAIIY